MTRREDAVSGVATAGRSLRYVVVSQGATALAALSAMLEAQAELVLVSRDPDAQQAKDVVGEVNAAALTYLLKTDEELS